MSPRVDGDARLGTRLADELGPRHPVAAVAVVTPSAVRLAAHGAGLDSDFELASVSKALTGLLYADAVGRGEVHPATTLGELLPLDGAPVAAVRLDALSTHRGGLPRLPSAAQPWRRTAELVRHGANPYRETLDELFAQARTVRVRRKAGPRYSNLGFELLGHAVAAAAGTTYADLVGRRLAGPLELTGLYVPADAARLRATALAGRSRRGREVTWHNGRSGGFCSWVGLDRAADTGVAVLSATAASVDGVGFRLLASP